MYAPSREDARGFLFATWRKFQTGTPLSDLERIAAELIVRHPEYQPVLSDPAGYRDRDYGPEQGETNPFLHLSLHLAVAEQLAIDQPAGIRAEFERLAAASGDRHQAEHALLDCLAEVVWQAQRHGGAPSADLYLDCLRRRN